MDRVRTRKNGYKFVSLFAGIGGLDLGFEFAGFTCEWANDFDKYACETYRANVGDKIVQGDIRLVRDGIPDHDVLIGGFPCQPFSTLGKLKGFEDEKRGTLFFEVLDIAVQHDTKVLVLENVKNLINHDEGRTFNRIRKELDEAGYFVNAAVLNSKDFGVPQRRNRVFIVAFSRRYFDESEFVYPRGAPLTVSTQDLLEENVDARYFLTKNIAKTILCTGTKGYVAKPTIDLPVSKTLTATMHKMHRASQDNYVTDMRSWERVMSDDRLPIRKLTPDECRKLQGFPSGWKQVVSDCQAYKQFGNAVTVNVSYAVAIQVLKYMRENKK